MRQGRKYDEFEKIPASIKPLRRDDMVGSIVGMFILCLVRVGFTSSGTEMHDM